jgi:hypothetical protein
MNDSPAIMSEAKRKICELDAKMIAYYRRNPCIACEDLLGIRLFDAQKYVLQNSWNASHSLWCCSRNFGKSFLGAVYIILRAILFENQGIYIVSSVGSQSKELFAKIEEIVLNIGKTAASIRSLKDLVQNETVKRGTNKTGFSHNPTGYCVEFYNGSEIFTLNSNPDNNRSKRSSLIFFDEAAYCSDQLIVVCEAFATQNTEFGTSIDDNYNPLTEKRKTPTQLIYASSQDEMSKLFYKHYKNFAKQMYAGNRDYFIADLTCECAINVFMEGKPYTPLLTRDKVEAAMKVNRDKALREYYNEPTRDGGINQVIRWGIIRRNECYSLPELTYQKGGKYVLAFDPARSVHQSVITVMRIENNPDIGFYGRLINCVNFVDLASKKKYKLDSNRQIDEIHNMLLDYNGNAPDYENIMNLLIDAGAGGGGVSTYGDGLLKEWYDDRGILHKGLLDLNYEIYEGYDLLYPNTSNAISLIDPRKHKKTMVEELVELLNLDLIKFPFEYQRNGYITVMEKNKDTEEEERHDHILSWDEEAALINLDTLKTELASIHRFKNAENTTVSYALPQDKQAYLNDDRFYSLVLLGHYLYELRRGAVTDRNPSQYEYHPFVN